jgi:hypothetical protein
MPAFSISLKGVAARAALGMGQRGQQTLSHSGSDKGDVAVRLAAAPTSAKPRIGPAGRAGATAPRPVHRPVGALGSGRSGGNPRLVKGPGTRPQGGQALGRGGARPHLSGTTSVRVSSGIHGGGSRGGRGQLGAGGVNMGAVRARSASGTVGRHLGGGGAGRPGGVRAGMGADPSRCRVGWAPLAATVPAPLPSGSAWGAWYPAARGRRGSASASVPPGRLGGVPRRARGSPSACRRGGRRAPAASPTRSIDRR